MRVLHYRHYTARKPHVCGYCGDEIPKGARYVRWTEVDVIGFRTHKAHTACDDVADDYYDGWGVEQEKRRVCADPLAAWAAEHAGDVRGELADLAKTWHWPPGEVDRMEALFRALQAAGERDNDDEDEDDQT